MGMRKFKGAVFDFNGTLIDDSEFHNSAWNSISMELRGRPFTEEELRFKIYGLNNSSIVEYLAGGLSGDKTMADLAVKKEKIYRDMCLANPDKFKLVPGAEDFLDYMKFHEIPRAIATASGLDNVEFYIERLDLYRWFTFDKIVYDNSSFPGKPAPAFYLIAAERLGLAPEDCIVFEDSAAGLKSANNAGIGKIIALNNDNGTGFKNYSFRIDMTIRDFTEIDAESLFN